jgi:adenine phosphoribosyltransferase
MNVEQSVESLKAEIRDVPDFPKPGILFKDITTLLKNPTAFRRAMDLLTVLCGGHPADKILAIESRGFIVGSALADRLGLGFVPLRKPGKLPANTIRQTYKLEYGEDCLEIHADALSAGDRVLIVDDVIATGGTAKAAGDLVTNLGGVVSAYVFLVELSFLDGRKRLDKGDVLSLIRY